MAEAKQTIKFNGKAYDARTGKPLNVKSSPKNSGGGVIDGFVKGPASRQKKAAHAPSPVAAKIIRPPAQRSKTLVRASLKKPGFSPPSDAKNENPLAKLHEKTQRRMQRANSISKSSSVSKFNRSSPKPTARKADSVKPTRHKSPPIRPTAPAALQPAVAHFERAMHEATAHLETFVPPKSNKKSRRKLAISAAAVSVLLAAGVFAYSMLPAANVKYAGTKAGFSANVPSYSPAGFGLSNNVASSAGEITMTYDSRTDDKNFKITQSPSNWSSQALLNNFVIPNYGANNYQTYEAQGKTIYINNNSNATWVDGGVWYRLEGNAQLTSDQLQRIVNSL